MLRTVSNLLPRGEVMLSNVVTTVLRPTSNLAADVMERSCRLRRLR